MAKNNTGSSSVEEMIQRMKRQSGLLSELKRADEEKDKAKRKEIERKIAGKPTQKDTIPSSVADTIQRMNRQSDLQTELRKAKTNTQRKAAEKKIADENVIPFEAPKENYRSSSVEDTIQRMKRQSDLLMELGETQNPDKRKWIEETIAKDSGTRNPVVNESLVQDIRDAAKYGDRNILRAKSEEFFSHYDGVLWVPYGRYQLLLMDDKVHVLGNGKDTAFPDTNAALDYIDKEKDYKALADIEELTEDIQSLSRDVTMIRPTHPEYQLLLDELNARFDTLARMGAEILDADGDYQIVRYNNEKFVIGNGINDKGYSVIQKNDGLFHVLGNSINAVFETPKDAHDFISNLKTPSVDLTDNTQWIPDTFQLNGSSDEEKYLAQRLSELEKVEWNQTKIDALWRTVEEINNQYQIQFDPRLLLAIIIQEGTGSFNTSSTNRAADGQHGIETNYAVDLMKANSLVFGKILGYIYYRDDFKKAVKRNSDKDGISGEGDVFQYCNWYTPIIDLNGKTVRTGVYAGHGAWHTGVKNIYNILSDGATSNYEAYISSIDKSVVQKIALDAGIELPPYDFIASQNAQDSRGKLNGAWTIRIN